MKAQKLVYKIQLVDLEIGSISLRQSFFCAGATAGPFFQLNSSSDPVDLLFPTPLKRKALKYSDGEEMIDI